MNFFRDNDKLNLLSADDRVEIFKTILLGSSDITKQLLDELIIDYCIENIEVIERK
jgi:hypothetical protein